jgi:hypothetical protein
MFPDRLEEISGEELRSNAPVILLKRNGLDGGRATISLDAQIAGLQMPAVE